MRGKKFDCYKTTALTIDPKFWNAKKGSIRPSAEFPNKQILEQDLYKLKGRVLETYNIDYPKGVLINSEWLNDVILKFFNQDEKLNSEYISDYTEFYIKNLPHKILANGNTGVKLSTYKKYKTTFAKLKEFETYKKKRYLISEVNMNFHRDFIEYQKTVKQLNYNTIGKYLKIIKTICKDANSTNGMKISDSLLNGKFKATREETSFITLDEAEISKIFEYDFSNSESLDNARNWLIIGVWTGCRVSDLLELNKDNLKNGYLEYTSQKTGKKTILPLHWQVESIISKLDGKFPRKISSQKFNDYIKIVCSDAGIKEKVMGAKRIDTEKKDLKGNKIFRMVKKLYPKSDLVSTHICRRSFATNHYGKLPTPIIMSATGHATERMLLNYIGKVPKENADILAEFWKTAKAKQDKTAQMEIIRNAK